MPPAQPTEPKSSTTLKVAPRVVAKPREDWAFADSPTDPLTAALAACMAASGRDVSAHSLLAGLPLPADGRLTPELALRAAEAQGFRAHLGRRTLAAIPESVLPCVLFLNGREACVLLSRRPDEARVLWAARSDEPVTIPRADLSDAYSGHVLLLRAESAQQAPDTPRTDEARGHWYWRVARRFWPDYLQVILASAVINLLALVIPIFTMNVYDRVFPNAALITLWSLVAGVGIAMVFDTVLKWVRSAVVDRVSRRVDQTVSSELFRHIADVRLAALTQPAGTLMNHLKDYEQVRDFFSSQTVATLTDLLFTVLFIAVIAYIGGPLAYPPALALAVVLLLGLVLLWPLRNAANAARVTGGIKNAVAVETVNDLETLKAVAGQGRMQARWEREVAQSAEAQEQSRKLATMATTLTALAQQASSVGIVVIGVYLALDGAITMGAVIAAMILSGRALAPTAALTGLFVRAGFAVSTLRSLTQVMDLPSEKSTPETGLNAVIERGALTATDVTLQYPNASLPALQEINMSGTGLDRIALIGPVGAGKTSLVRVLAGLYQPDSGLVLLDGLNMAQIGSAALRAHVQLVPQDAVLFSGTLAENIAFGRPGALDRDVLHAARLAGVDQIAAVHPEGFAMPITERGRNLSGGQRQMVALARALLPRPKVLILDEPTSSMDSQSERQFIARLTLALRERPMTLIVSTHRMGLLDLVDRVIVLDKGRIVVDGPKADVLARLERGGTPAETP